MLNVGDSLTMELKHTDEVEKYKCKVLDLKANILYIDYPINIKTGRIGIFLEGTQFKISFVSKDSSVYLFDTEVRGRKKVGNIPMVVLDFPGRDKLIKIQRREYVRVETAVDVAIHPLQNEFSPFTTITSDISAGGAAILLPVNHKLRKDMNVSIWFVIPLANGDYHYLKIVCKVVRILQTENGREKAPIQFIDTEESERQIITRLCFDRQLAHRRKGIE